eukprot:gene6526-8968_t
MEEKREEKVNDGCLLSPTNFIELKDCQDLKNVGRNDGSSLFHKLIISNEMPMVSDKFLLRLEYLMGDGIGLNQENASYAALVANELKYLSRCLERERFGFDSEQINAMIGNIESSKSIPRGFYLKFREEIISRLRPFDIDEVLHLIKQTETATQNISGKETIFLVGKTGCGKSSTTHYLAGSKMAYGNEVEKENVVAANYNNDHLINVKIGATAQSTTRFISAVKISYGGTFTKKDVWLCDTAGFDDTSGAEVDVANSVGFIQALKACKSVRFLLLFSMKGGNKAEEVVDVTRSIAHIVPNDEIQNFLPSCSYGITRGKHYQTFMEQLMTINPTNQSQGEILEDLLSKSQAGRVKLIDPLDSSSAA